MKTTKESFLSYLNLSLTFHNLDSRLSLHLLSLKVRERMGRKNEKMLKDKPYHPLLRLDYIVKAAYRIQKTKNDMILEIALLVITLKL